MIDSSQINLASVGRRDPTPPCPPPVGRRVPTPPLKRGVTLVELLISMLILAIVCIAWLQIIGIQSARKEARRREAVDRLAGMMDAFMYINSFGVDVGCYCVYHTDGNYMDMGNDKKLVFTPGNDNEVRPVFKDDVSPIGYRLRVVEKRNLHSHQRFGSNWGDRFWLVGELYNKNGIFGEGKDVDEGDLFCRLQVYLGVYEPEE